MRPDPGGAAPRIAFVTPDDPRDRRSWSGTPFYSARSLERQGLSVARLGPCPIGPAALLGKFRSRLGRPLGQCYDWRHGAAVARAHGRFFSERLRRGDYDLVFACGAATEVAELDTELPLVYLSDNTFANMLELHLGDCRLSARNRAQGHAIEAACIRRAAACLYASDWAAGSAIRDYGADPARIRVLPLGANLDRPPAAPNPDDYRPSGRANLLFLGVDWVRKGGPVALDALRALRAEGLAARLTVCGCRPPPGVTDPDLRVIPFLDKNDPTEAARLCALLEEADFLILPTRAECFGLVFCEASAFGVPAVASDTGGVSSAVVAGENGHLLPAGASGLDYARLIAGLYRDPAALRALRASSRRVFERSHNWDAWAGAAAGIIQAVVRGQPLPG